MIGGGYWGKNLIRDFYSINALHTVCDVNEKALKTYKETYPLIKTTNKWEKLLQDEEITAIVISLPANIHYKFAKDALTSGGLMPAVLNAANEIAVEKFINNEIKFDLIFDTIKHVMEKFDKENSKIDPSLEQILEANEKARSFSLNYIKKI